MLTNSLEHKGHKKKKTVKKVRYRDIKREKVIEQWLEYARMIHKLDQKHRGHKR